MTRVATRNRGSVPMSHRPLSFVKTNPAAGATVVELWSGSIRKSLALYTGAQRDCMIPVLTKMPDPWHSKLRSCYVWLLPLLAFAALGLLLVFGGEHWLYQLPSFQTPSADTQLFWGRRTLCGERWNFQPLSSPALPWRWQVGWKQRLPGTALRRQNECLSGLQSTAGDDKVVGALTLELLQRILNE